MTKPFWSALKCNLRRCRNCAESDLGGYLFGKLRLEYTSLYCLENRKVRRSTYIALCISHSGSAKSQLEESAVRETHLRGRRSWRLLLSMLGYLLVHSIVSGNILFKVLFPSRVLCPVVYWQLEKQWKLLLEKEPLIVQFLLPIDLYIRLTQFAANELYHQAYKLWRRQCSFCKSVHYLSGLSSIFIASV